MIEPEIPANEEERLGALACYDIVETPPDPFLDNLTELVREQLGVPYALVSIIERDRQWFMARAGLEGQHTPRRVSFCAHVVALGEPLIIENAKNDDRFAGNPFVTGEPWIRAYAGMPLRSREGLVLGTLCALDSNPRHFTEDEISLLSGLRRSVESHLELLRTRREEATAAQQAARERERYRFILDNATDAIVRIGADGEIREVNHAAEALYGRPASEMVGQKYRILLPEEDREAAIEQFRSFLELGEDAGTDSPLTITRGLTRAGQVLQLETYVVESALGGDRSFTFFHRDISERVAQQRELTLRKQRLELANRAARAGQWETVGDHRLRLDHRAFALLGKDGQDGEISVEGWCEAAPLEDREDIRNALQVALEGQQSGRFEHRVVTSASETHFVSVSYERVEDPASTNGRVVGLVQDITTERTVEPTSGLPNALALREELARQLAAGTLSGSLIVLHAGGLRDLDQLSSEVADNVARQVGVRIKKCVPPSARVYRLIGASFAVLLPSAAAEAARLSCTAIEEAVGGEQFEADGRSFFVSPSLGIVELDHTINSAEVAIRAARAACRTARESQLREPVLYTDERERVAERLALEADLRRALDDGDLVGHLQPIIDLPTTRVAGFEILARWSHPTRGAVSPGAFIPVAEQAGLISALGWQMIEHARLSVAALADVHDATYVTVNIAAEHLYQDDFVSRFLRATDQHELGSPRVRIEITERTLLEDADLATKRLRELRIAGVQICLDDFGTGYSSLAYLHRLPLDVVKIDRRFVQRIGESTPDTKLVLNILRICADLGLDSVAEGIETESQHRFLKAVGCDYAQGYHYGRPGPLGEAMRTLTDAPPLDRSDGLSLI